MMGKTIGLATAFMAFVCVAYVVDSPIGWVALAIFTVVGGRYGWKEIRGTMREGADAGVAGDLPPHVRRALEGRKK